MEEGVGELEKDSAVSKNCKEECHSADRMLSPETTKSDKDADEMNSVDHKEKHGDQNDRSQKYVSPCACKCHEDKHSNIPEVKSEKEQLRETKLERVMSAFLDNDLKLLKRCAVEEFGLVSDDVRRKVWPKLVGTDVFDTSPKPSQEEIDNHNYYHQVVLDVNRSLKRFPPSIKENQRLAMQDQLILLIMCVLVKHPELHYYQGYHDICVTFLLVLGEEDAYYVVEKLSVSHLKLFMDKTMEPTVRLLSYIYPLIGKVNPKLMAFLNKSEVGVAYCVSWLITWFGHVLSSYDDVVRLFDLFIVSHSWMPIYLSAALVLHRESKIMKLDCDMASVHSFLSKIPDSDLPFEELIVTSRDLYEKYPPAMLEKEYIYVPYSKAQKSWFSKAVDAVYSSQYAVPVAIAAAVLVAAVAYQAYKY